MKIKVGAVSYLNAKPLLYGIRKDVALMQSIELREDYPKRIGEWLREGSIDLGLIPIAFIPQIPHAQIVSDYCIGSQGRVASVKLYSDVPVGKIEKVLLDYQSFTSVNLCKVLFQYFYKTEVVYMEAEKDYIDDIKGTTAGVIIGDRVFEYEAQKPTPPFAYDLAEEWTKFTRLPFVMAMWVANKDLPTHFIAQFNKANEDGLNSLSTVITQNPYPYYNLAHYFTHNICYRTDDNMKASMQYFLQLMQKLPLYEKA